MRFKWFSALILTILSGNVLGADTDGNFAMKGAGLLTCEIFVEAREARSETYYMIGGWLDGYITALNQYAESTYDITSFESTELIVNVMQNHCKSNPDDRLFTVINSIMVKLTDDRLQNRSRKIAVNVGEYETLLYQETLYRIQSELKRLGYMTGEFDSEFSSNTEAALRSFQRSIKLEATGFPDQTTLWRLLRKES